MQSESDVLNPYLYRRLRRALGRIEVSHQGEAMSARVVIDFDGPRSRIDRWGETYRVCCPFCDDNNFSLGVNHRYGQRDVLGRPMTYAAFCNRRECLARPGRM